jgi:hypothetical protein
MRRSLFTHRPTVSAGVFCLTLGLAASAAQACAPSPPDRNAMYPGMTLIRPDMILLLPILSGALERPLYALAGLREPASTLAFSIQANLLAMLACVAATIAFFFAAASANFGFHSDRMLWWLMWVGLPSIGAGVKYLWLGRLPVDRPSLPIGPVVALATLGSTAAIATIPFWMHLFGTDTYAWADRILIWKAIATVAVLFASAWAHLTLFSRFSRPPRGDGPRGFEVSDAPALPVAQPA